MSTRYSLPALTKAFWAFFRRTASISLCGKSCAVMLIGTELWTLMVSFLGLVTFGQTILNVLLPAEMRAMLSRMAFRILGYASSYTFVEVPEYDGVTDNELYGAIKLHLSSTTPLKARRLNLYHTSNANGFTYSPANNEHISVSYGKARMSWEHQVLQKEGQRHAWRPAADEKRCFILKLHKQDKDMVLVPYLEHVIEHAKEVRRLHRGRLLYTNTKGMSWDDRSQPWDSVPFKHPSTFETLALDPDRKQKIMADLHAFSTGGEFYRRAGRAWKRGYLLHGPPGTGKSSMIAAMSNFLGYDVYDLELMEVQTNAELRKLLIRTTNKSIIVIEDIDCCLNLTDRSFRKQRVEPKATEGDFVGLPNADDQSNSVTLSGLLNFTDGLWSCCGNERIFVFTTNHIEQLDSALLRSRRMDMHIHMSYCTFSGFKILVHNYLGLQDHRLYRDIKRVLDSVHITPADVSEILIQH
ncbi:hypothetical protein L7F22_002917 [Adiantum nelumboides]|nr:hypothetical protein [Adiantum nelumboides]